MTERSSGSIPIFSNPNGILSTEQLIQQVESKATQGGYELIKDHVSLGISNLLPSTLAKSIIDSLAPKKPTHQLKYIEEWRRVKKSDTSMVFLHGFNAHKSAHDDWSNGLMRSAEEQGVSLYALRWGCDFDINIINTIALDPIKLIIDFTSHFKSMRDVADREARNLHDDLAGIPGKLILVGHSLGARLMMQAIKHGHARLRERLVGAVALAPAVREDDVLVERPWKRSLVCYSRSDTVLKLAYRTSELEDAIGYEGPKSSSFLSLDLSDLELGHTDYARHAYDILRRPEVVRYLEAGR